MHSGQLIPKQICFQLLFENYSLLISCHKKDGRMMLSLQFFFHILFSCGVHLYHNFSVIISYC